MSGGRQFKKTPPAKETSFDFRLSERSYSAREQQAIARIKRRLGLEYLPVIPTWLLSGVHQEKLGPAFATLVLIIRACDWSSGIWCVRKYDLKVWFDWKTSKTLKNHLKRMAYLNVEWSTVGFGEIEVYLPLELNPAVILEKAEQSRERKKYSAQKQQDSVKKENNFPKSGKDLERQQEIQKGLNELRQKGFKTLGAKKEKDF